MTKKTKSGNFLIRFLIVSFFRGAIFACLDLDLDPKHRFSSVADPAFQINPDPDPESS
jgi:hypothetical protein